MPMYPTPAELESQKRRLRHKAAPIVSHEPIIVEESWAKANMVPLIGAVVGLTSLAIVGTTLAVLNKKKHFIGGHHVEEEEEESTTTTTSEEEGESWGTKLKSGAKKAAIGAGVSKVMSKWGHHEEESTTTSEEEGESFGHKMAGVGKKAALAAGVHQFMKPKTQKKGFKSRFGGMLHSSSELEHEGFMGRVMHAPFVGKVKNKMPFFAHPEEESTTTTSEEEQMMHQPSRRRGLSSKLSGLAAAPFIGKMKNKMPFIGHQQHYEEGSETTSTSASEDEGMNWSGKAKKAAGLAAAGYGLKKAINRNASASSTTSTSASEDEGLGQKVKGAALGMGLSRAMQQKPKQKKVIKKRVIKRKVVPTYNY